jgi:hypothetical protein
MAEILHLSPRREHRLRSRILTHAPDAGLVAVFALAAWVAFSWYQTIGHIVRDYSPVPKFDYWRTAAFLHFYQAFDLSVLWRQHNEHRIIFPEIVFAADLLFLHGRELLPIALGFLCYLGNWLVLAWAFWSIKSMSKLLRAVAVLAAGVIIGWQGSAFNIADSFLLQWTLTDFAACLSLVFLVRLKETARLHYLIATIISAAVANYSSANGLTLWAVLIGAAFILSISRREMVVLWLAAALLIGVYFIGYQFTGTLSIKNLLLHPFYATGFVGSYLSMPFGVLKSPRFGMHLGVTAMLILAVLAFIAVRSGLIRSRAGIVLFGTYAFLVITASITAAGRMNPADPGFSGAKPPRYVSGPLVGWGVFILLCIWFGSRWRRSAGYAASLTFAVLLALALPKLRWWMQQQDTEFARAQLMALAMEQEIYDPTVILSIFPDPISAEMWSKGIHDNHLSVFYKNHARWLGRPAEQFAKKVDAVVPGEVTYTLPVRDGVEVAGWFDTSNTTFRHVQWMLFANESGNIVGFGRKLPAGFPDSIDSPRTPRSLGWVGFINLKYPVKTFNTYLADRRGLIPLQGSTGIPNEQVADALHAGAPIPGIQWQMDPGWIAAGIPKGWPFGYPPPGPVYSSWNGDDAHTGRLMSCAFPRPKDGCLIVPVLQGPRGADLSAAVVNAATNQWIAHAWFDNAPSAWKFWRMIIPDNVAEIRVLAEDKGKGWGQWLAIGPPLRCK